ncbi:DUF2974 domain-containing protein [Bifidobacterium canis]|uniref:Alpha/beta hydrolase n=1 Tax=Bifidobacterium canis TaxID=2610880 RepID=A0A7K1J4F3_9BIFI|nr:DUF2974 domain-containing protein [Bifidobacterium canis]MUH59533.1 alpha/beta hydrolase [Bifidobacterium canis]
MGTIVDYASLETRDFSQYPFRAADAMVYALLSYDKIPAEIPSIDELMQRYGSTRNKLRGFDIKHPAKSVETLWRTPFDGPTLRQLEEHLHPDAQTGDGFKGDANASADAENGVRTDDDANSLVADAGDAAPAMNSAGEASDGATSATNGKTSSANRSRHFYELIKRNPRFAVTRMSATEERFDQTEQTQYAAMTFQLPDGTLVVSFRGTDDSLIGWREDFNMAHTYPVPAQTQAADYVEKIGKLWPNARIILTGHSKGGNIAIYAAMNVHDQVKDRIDHVYAFDSPGFMHAVVSSYEYGTIADRVTKLVPEQSIIGMLMESNPNEHQVVVKSNAEGVMQHYCYSWLMDGDRFQTLPELSESSQTFHKSLNEWLNGMTQRQRKKGVEALFRVLSAGGHSSMTQLRDEGVRALPSLLGSYVGLDSEDRRYINQVMMMFAGTLFAH